MEHLGADLELIVKILETVEAEILRVPELDAGFKREVTSFHISECSFQRLSPIAGLTPKSHFTEGSDGAYACICSNLVSKLAVKRLEH